MKALTSVCIVVAIIVLLASAAFAEDDPTTSGWPQCDLLTSTYDQEVCISLAEHWKGTTVPHSEPATTVEAIENYEWAVHAPRPLSPCSAVGVGGSLLPMDYQTRCEDIPSPTATLVPTVAPLPTIQPQTTPAVHIWTTVLYLPIVGDCSANLNTGFKDCGN